MTFLEELEQTPPAAKMVLPAAVLALVSRQKHPIVWWVFGVIPLASAAAQAIREQRLFGPKAQAAPVGPVLPGTFLPEYPGQRPPGSPPDFINPDGSAGYVFR
jgi:hypothetical protein